MQTRRKSRICSRDKDELWQEFMEHIDKRFTEFKQKDLKSHHALLKNWKSRLAETREWYSNSTEKFQSLVTSVLKRQPLPDMESYENGVGGRDKFLWELAKSVSTTQQQHTDGTQESRLAEADTSKAALHDHSYCRPPGSCKVEFQPHQCGANCFMDLQLKDLNISPLRIPLVLGWQRQVCRRQNSTEQQDVIYVTPCKRKLRSLDEVRQYLDLTSAKYLKGLHFTFDPHCSLLSVPFEPKDSKTYLDDLSNGKETTPVSCVNMYNQDLPKAFDYITKCTVEPSVRSATPTGFLVCCDCTDNCVDRSKCACWQLTLEEARLVGNVQFSVGYVHHRLKRPQHSAVYECHSGCGCGERCSNRVVQGGTRHRLQVFHTGNPQLGWAVRTLDDIPEGSFVCAYFGNIHAEIDADEIAKQHGDEYFADLDYMEVVDRHKANYEATVPPLQEKVLGEELAAGLGEGLTAAGECNYRFSHKKSVRSMASSSGTVTPGESALSGRGSSNLSKHDSSMESLAGPSSGDTSPLSSLSGISSLSQDMTSENNCKLAEDQATPMTPPTAASMSSSLPDDVPSVSSAPQQLPPSPPNSSSMSKLYSLKLRSRSSLPVSPSTPPSSKVLSSGTTVSVSEPSTRSGVPPSATSAQSSSPRSSRRNTRSSWLATRSTRQATRLLEKSVNSCDVSPQSRTTDLSEVAHSNSPSQNKPRCLQNIPTKILKNCKAKSSSGSSTVSSGLPSSPMRSLRSLRSGSPSRAPSTPPKRKRQSSPIPCPQYLALSPGHTPPSSPEPEGRSIPPPQDLKREPSFLSLTKEPSISSLKSEPSFLSLQVKPGESESPSTSPLTRGLSTSRTSAVTPPLRSSPRLRAKLGLLSKEAANTNNSQLPQITPSTNLWTSSKECHQPSPQVAPDVSSQSNPSTSNNTSTAIDGTRQRPLHPAGIEVGPSDQLVNEQNEIDAGALRNKDTHHQRFRTRRFFHEDCVYFMDAKDKGNVGRFLNHSCSPNLFVQNVFVDNHDLRFPWVAFFAARRISAMEELTWDYNYEVGSVEDKVIQCLCGTPNCRKRLL